MSILKEYLSLDIISLQNELKTLINRYNSYTKRYLFIYASNYIKNRHNHIDPSLDQHDYYIIQDLLREVTSELLDFYIETPGGSGESAEEIAKYLRKQFREVNFVIAGEAKSAGTILVMSGDNIFMTDTGSLGPIDAQVKIGRSVVSAHDYKEWVDKKREEAEITKKLNPFDALVISQISPGELGHITNSLEFAKDLVSDWLVKYKFKNWIETETNKNIVDDEYRKKRADEIASKLCNHTEWRTHGRSLKIEDLKEVLKIERIDEDTNLSDIVYRIKTLIRLIFNSSTTYKIFFHSEADLFLNAMPEPNINKNNIKKKVEVIEVDIACYKCNHNSKILGYIGVNEEFLNKSSSIRKNETINKNNYICKKCGTNHNLGTLKNEVEKKIGKKILFY